MPAKTKAHPQSVKQLDATQTRLPVIRLRVTELRQQHGYRYADDLWKALLAMGVEISYSQLTRIINNQADKLDKNLLAAFTVLFKCSVQDLFE